MENTIKQRLIAFIEHKGISVRQFEREAGLSNGYMKSLRNAPSLEKMRMIIDTYPELNKKWLETGEGNMLVNDDPPNYEVTPLIRQRHGIPLVSQYAYAGYLSGYADAEYMDSLPIVDFTPDREMTGNWLAFEVRGDSMDNGSREAYCQGDIVITREVKPHLWRDSKLHIHRRDFVIVHEDGILIKRIIDHDVEHHTITIHSLNPDYPDRVIDLAQVRKIFSIVESRQNRAR